MHAPAPSTFRPIVLDIEASGFGRGSYPIEIGCALADGSSFCTLIKPAETWQHWDQEAARVHGISRDLLAQRGRPASEVAQLLNSQLHGQVVYSDAWYHDYGWLNVLFEEAESSPSFRLEHLASLIDEARASRWNDTRAAIELEQQSPRHRASADARVLQLTWLRLAEQPLAEPRG